MAPLILASGSPRRRELLQLLGRPFEVMPSRFEEPAVDRHPQPHLHARLLAVEKATEVARRMPGRLVLGADTLVVIDGRILGKPADRVQAADYLRMLSGQTHRVITGVALLDDRTGRSRRHLFHRTTRVRFRPLRSEWIEQYLDTEEPYDKAGAYGAQGQGGVMIESIIGCPFNVIGLPLAPLDELFLSLDYGGQPP